MKKRPIFIVLAVLMAISLLGGQIAFAAHFPVWTTNASGDQVNGNIYLSKSDVWLNGGPHDDFPNNNYYVKVTDPSGHTVLGSVYLAEVTDGKFFINLYYETSFQDTPNNGNEYKVWVSTSEDFPQSETNFDNFKVFNAEIDLDKSVNQGSASVGDTVIYTYVITNTGEETLSGITLKDDIIGDINLDATTLAPGNSMTVTVEYTIPSGIDGDTLTNVAEVTGYFKVQGNDYPVSDTDTAVVEIITVSEEPSIMLTKTANVSTAMPDQKVTYTYTITNTGDMDLDCITLTDNVIGEITVPTTSLCVDDAPIVIVVPYDIPENAEPGELTNIATVKGYYGECGSEDYVTDEATYTINIDIENMVADIELTKTASLSEAKPNDTITYTYTIKNTGNYTLTGLSLYDDKLGDLTSYLSVSTLSPDADTVVSQTYTVPANAKPGKLVNTATVTGYYVVDNEEQSVTDVAAASVNIKTSTTPGTGEQNPAIEVKKSVNKSTAKPGEEVTYSYTVTNTGDVTLTEIILNDDKLGALTLNETTLNPGESTVVNATYTIPGDAAKGTLTNIATVTGYYEVEEVKYSVTDTDTAKVNIQKDSGTPGGGGGDDDNNGDDNGGGGGGDGSTNESITVDQEPGVGTPQGPPQGPGEQPKEEFMVPGENPIGAPKGDLPYTGGNPMAFVYAGFALAGLGMLLRRRK